MTNQQILTAIDSNLDHIIDSLLAKLNYADPGHEIGDAGCALDLLAALTDYVIPGLAIPDTDIDYEPEVLPFLSEITQIPQRDLLRIICKIVSFGGTFPPDFEAAVIAE